MGFLAQCALLAMSALIVLAQESAKPDNPEATKSEPTKPDTAKPEVSTAEPKKEGDEEADDSGVAAPVAPTGNANLAGQVNTSRGEARRNENVQVNLVDNNAARDANQRVGPTATIVEEFRSERNYYATEFGGGSKGPLHAASQFGSGKHGTLFWNHGNSVFNARTFFQAGPVQPARQNQYGAAFSTGLWKNGFFSFNGSQDKNRGMVNGNVLILKPNERIPLTTDPARRAIVLSFIDAFPNVAPNRLDIADRTLNTNSPQTVDTNVASGQINQKLSARDALVARYTFTGQDVKAFQFVKGQNPDTANKSHAARLTWNRTWSANTISDLSFGFDRQGALLVATEDAVGPVFINGLQTLGPVNNIPLDRAQNQWISSFSGQSRQGRHNLVAGGTLIRRQYNSSETDGHRRILQFRQEFGNDLITNLRLGLPSLVFQTFGDVYRAFRNWDGIVFAGDHWNVNNKFNVNLGVRWEPTTRPAEAALRSNLPFDSDLNNVGGNLGFAYRLPGGLGAIRGAAGVFFGQIYPVTYGQDRYNRPGNVRLQVQAPDLVNPFGNLDLNNIDPKTRATDFVFSPDLAVPYSYQYNFSWESEIAHGWRLQTGYVGSSTRKLFQIFILNRGQFLAGVPWTLATVNDRRADANSLDKVFIVNSSNAFYNAGRVTLTAPNFHGLTASTSYWFAKAIDTGGDYNATGGDPNRFGQGGQTELGVKGDLKGLSNFDQPHAFQANVAYSMGRLGGGWMGTMFRNWTVTSAWLLKSGTPFDLSAGSDGPGFGNVDGVNGDRINVVDPSVIGQVIGNPDTSVQMLARSKFSFMNTSLGQFRGNLGKNTLRKGKIANVNASLTRSWTLNNDLQMNLRAEAVNFFNTPQFAMPGNNVAAPNFGQITNTLNEGRSFRMTLRLSF